MFSLWSNFWHDCKASHETDSFLQVAYAENQSMFLDSLMSDGEWISRYALSR